MACGPLFAYPRRLYREGMDDILTLPAGALADASLAVVRSSASEPIADHSIRSFLFARLLAEHEGCLNDAAYDEELLFAATVMHDLGLGKHARAEARFEAEGARCRRSRRRPGLGGDRPALVARSRRAPRPPDLPHLQGRLHRRGTVCR